ncbi:MAG: hypothetical protein DME25_03815 [Verrucomicrobia bacterium]|nr:MAG: hypothetical protein DME25_03815 [Verrucomicrobiota bacterium]
MKLIKPVIKLIACGCVISLLSGCASVLCGTKQSVALDSKPIGAKVLVYDSHCEIAFEGTTPCVAKLPRRNSDYECANYVVLLKKPGFAPVQIALNGQLNRAYLANILTGGIGFLADPITGGMWTLTTEGADPKVASENGNFFHSADSGLLVSLQEQAPPTIAEHFKPVDENEEQ